MPSASKPWWQQATALVSLGAGGAVTGFSFVPRPAADLTSPTSLPVHLMALEQSARPAAADDGALRSAIVNVANYYRRMAESKTPAEMEAIIWQHDSIDGANHGAVLRGVCQPDAGARRPRHRPAELGHAAVPPIHGPCMTGSMPA